MARQASVLESSKVEVAGTPNYMSPELFSGSAASYASDTYAFGVLLGEIFSRDVPFDGLPVADIRRKVLAGERPKIAPAGVPKEVAQLVRECTAQLPAQRPQGQAGWAKIIQALQAVLQQQN
jgi:serine/threonine protein kinase